jgi:hypothetical protein
MLNMTALNKTAKTFLTLLACLLFSTTGVISAQADANNAGVHATSALANCSPGIPASDCQATMNTYNFLTTHNFATPPGLSGNKPYQNSTGLLPAGGAYLEYDIYPPGPNGRLSQRLVVDRNNTPGNSWFSPDHYDSFSQFYTLA